MTNGELRKAIQLYCSDAKAAKKQYGRIETWDTSKVTDMRELFSGSALFNADLCAWNRIILSSLSYRYVEFT